MTTKHQRKADAVLSVCREALIEGVSMNRALREIFDFTSNQASRWIRRLRTAGHLPPDDPIGRHRMAQAVIHRGSAGERRWMVCQACLSPDCKLNNTGEMDRTENPSHE